MEDLQKKSAELTKVLVDSGYIIEGGWRGFMLLLDLDKASFTQKTEMRKAFFAGADHLFSSILSILDPGSEPSERDLRRMNLINAELQEFQKKFRADYPLHKGKVN